MATGSGGRNGAKAATRNRPITGPAGSSACITSAEVAIPASSAIEAAGH